MTNGYVNNTRGNYGESELRAINGTGPMGRYLKRNGELAYAAGHGQLPESVIFTEGGSQMYKEVNLSKANGPTLAQQILAAEQLAVIFDENGDAVLRSLGFDPEQREEFTLDEDSFLEQGIDDSADNDGPTRLKITATRPELLDDCGLVANTLTTEAKTLYQPQSATTTTCSPSTFIGGPPYILRLTMRVKVVTTRRCGTVVATSTLTDSYYNPVRAVGTLDGVSCFFGPQYADGTAVRYVVERFMRTSDESVSRQFDERCYMVKEVKEVRGYYNPRAGLYQRASITSNWAEIGNTNVQDDGEGVFYQQERVLVTERVTRDISVDDDGFITQEFETIQRWHKLDRNTTSGTNYLYNDGSISTEKNEIFRTVETRTISYQSLSDDLYQKVTIVKTTEGTQEILVEEFEGFLPAAEICDEAISDDEMYDVPPDESLVVDASNFDSETIECEVISKELESQREVVEEETSSSWVETDGECEALGWHLIREGSKIQFKGSLPVSAVIRAGQRVRVSIPSRGLTLDRFRLERVRHIDRGGFLVTNIEGSHYPKNVTPK
jgi:hypothetical protein